MSTNISSMLNTRLRFSGMASGLDTESIIKQLMSTEMAKVNRVKQDRQLLEWKRDDYRNITNMLRAFKDKYFDVLSPNNLLSSSAYNKYATTATDPTVVKATANSIAAASTHSIEVIQTATVGKVIGNIAGGTFSANGELIIDSTTYSYSAGQNIEEFVDVINNDSAAVVKLSYDSVAGDISIATKSTGSVAISGSFITDAGMSLVGGVIGRDAQFTMDGLTRTSKSNTFTEEGITYTLLKAGESNIIIDRDTNGIVENIKSFVENYNSILSTINGELSEKRYMDYAPLTDDQKKEMSEDDIKLWEEKARSGLLRGDGLLDGLVSRLRKAVNDPVGTNNDMLASIGITTGNYLGKGQLTIDETKLREAIEANPDKVMSIFNSESSTPYTPNTYDSTRFKENGVVTRLEDILKDYIRTTRDANSKKGLLIEKAGITGDSSEYTNYMLSQIKIKDDIVSTMMERYYAKEDSYYRKFTAMETALNNMNSQSAWLSQQLGSSSQ